MRYIHKFHVVLQFMNSQSNLPDMLHIFGLRLSLNIND